MTSGSLYDLICTLVIKNICKRVAILKRVDDILNYHYPSIYYCDEPNNMNFGYCTIFNI